MLQPHVILISSVSFGINMFYKCILLKNQGTIIEMFVIVLKIFLAFCDLLVNNFDF